MIRPAPRAAALTLHALALTVALSCRDRPSHRLSERLSDRFPLAEVSVEVDLIDLGTDPARELLGGGWSWNESSGEIDYVWSVGPESWITFPLTRPRALEVEFRCRPLESANGSTQEIRLWINSTSLPPVSLARGMNDYAVALPANALKAGQNTLRMQYEFTRSPYEMNGSGDHRQLGVAWDWIRLGLEPSREEPFSDPLEDTLSLPPGYLIDYYYLARPGDRLMMDAIENPNPGRVTLDASYLDDSVADELPLELEARPTGLSVDLPTSEEGPARLRFRVSAVGERSSSAPIVIRGSRLETISDGNGAPNRSKSAPPARSMSNRPNILIYLVDTLRSDRLGVYGGPAGLSPAIDNFASAATVFDHAFAHSSWTKPSVASLLTGLLPFEHGVNHRRHRLGDSFTTLAERLQIEGYASAAFATNPYFTPQSGLRQGFDHFDLSQDRTDLVRVRIFSWLQERDPDRPFLLYVHTVEPHDPYLPPEEFRRRWAPSVTDRTIGTGDHIRKLGRNKELRTPGTVAALEQLYDAEVAYADHEFGQLLDGLQERGFYEDSLIVFVSDHGEAFYEHGAMGHGWDLYREVVEVPLILRLPGQTSPRRIDQPRRLVDLVPTILEFLSLESDGDLAGNSLIPHPLGPASATSSSADLPVFSYLDYDGRRGISVVLGRWKLIQPLSSSFLPQRLLFDRLSDPNEQRDLAIRHPARAGWLATQAREQLQILDSLEAAESVDFDDATERRLRALGYVD